MYNNNNNNNNINGKLREIHDVLIIIYYVLIITY